MNERIEKLAVEARQYAFGEVENSQDLTEWSTKYYNEMFEQKFAQLIVKKCIDIAQDRAAFDWAPPNDVNHIISEMKEHFGVEECSK